MSSAYDDAVALRDAGRFAEAETRARAWLADRADDPRGRALLRNLLLLQAKVQAPADPAAAVDLARELAGRQGPGVLQGADEGARLQRAVDIVLGVLDAIPPASRAVAANLLRGAGAYEAAASLGGIAELGRLAVESGDSFALLRLLTRVETDADRLEVLALHRAWGRRLEQAAAERPIVRRPRRGGERMRLGFLSSDLRHHVVAYFAQPLFQAIDPRFELFVYSAWPGAADMTQQWFAGRAAAYRILPGDDHAAAQMIADDGLDLLLELGGPTAWSRPGILPYRPAPQQVSWLGYPHSLGLDAVDHYLGDPYLLPGRPELLLERPLAMPRCWIVMAPAAYPDSAPLRPEPPALTAGHVTFGTMNDPYKMNPRVLRTWARTVAAVPGARFMIVRPECGAPVFRETIARRFAAEGVAAERIEFRAVRGNIRPLYAEIDIAVDTFPVTGGATTCEALWCGVPTVTLVGEAPYERLSWSILANAGLPELAATTPEGFVATAAALAGDLPRLAALRATMRQRIRAHPLGQPELFVRDFYELMAQTIDGQAS